MVVGGRFYVSIFSKLWRYVHTYGYPISTSPIVPAAAKSSNKRARGDARAVQLEPIEQRLLLTTVFGGERFLYTDATGDTIMAQLNGGALAAELIAAVQTGDGSLLFGDIEGTILAVPGATPATVRPGAVIGNGSAPVSVGLFGNQATQGLAPVLPAGPQNNLGGVASNANGQTFAMNMYNVDGTGKKMAADAFGNVEWTVKLLSLDNARGTGTEIDDLTFALQDPGTPAVPPPIDPTTGLPVIDPITGLPSEGTPAVPGTGVFQQLDWATTGKISGGSFNQVVGLYYFVIEFKPVAAPGTTTVIQDQLFSIDPTAGDPTATLTPLITLDNQGGDLPVTAITFQSTSATTATLWAFSTTAGTAVADGLSPGLLGYNFVRGEGFPTYQEFQSPDFEVLGILQGFQAPAATNPVLLGNVTGLVSLPSTIPNATAAPGHIYLFAAVAGTADSIYRIDINLDTEAATATNFGSTTGSIGSEYPQQSTSEHGTV